MGFTDRLRAALALAGADPRARDSRPDPWSDSAEWDTQAPDRGDIEDWVDEYKANPLIHVPTDMFASDVSEPGYRVDLAEEDAEPPTVPRDRDRYGGEPLDDALEQWLGEAAIIAGEFGRDFGDLIEDLLKDVRAKRGTALVEHAYDDRAEPSRILGLRLFKAETVTAYTRPGKGILLRPDDGQDEDDTAGEPTQARRSASFDNRRTPPQTPAGETAAYVQYDDRFGRSERDEIAFSQSDVTKVTNNPDTGEVFGQPDVAQVYDRAVGIRQQLKDLDMGLKGKMFGYWIAQVGSETDPVSKSQATELVEDMNLNDPRSKTAVPYQVEPNKFDGDVPDVENLLQYQIEYVLSAMPTPLYRIGFAGDINRDITGEQREDYQDDVRRWRRRIESAFAGVLQMKANELMGGELQAEPAAAPEVHLRIEPEEDESPLRDEEFDATAFKELMQGLKAGAPGGAPELVLPPETIVEKILKMDPEEARPDAPDAPQPQPGGQPPEEGGGPPTPDDVDEEAVDAIEDTLAAAAETDD